MYGQNWWIDTVKNENKGVGAPLHNQNRESSGTTDSYIINYEWTKIVER